MDLYIDGNIAQMFSPAGAVQYFSRLLGVDSRSLRPTLSQEQPHAFFITSQAVYAGAQDPHPSLVIDGRPLDYAISQAGTIIPQRLWSPTNSTDALRFSNLLLNMPIFFVRNDRTTMGLPLLRAIEPLGAHETLLGAGNMAPVGNCSTTYIRINVSSLSMIKHHLRLEVMLLKFLVLQWPGYGEWSSQIMTRDQTIAHNTITLAKFAKRVANAVVRFLDVSNPFVLRVLRAGSWTIQRSLSFSNSPDVLFGAGGRATSRAKSKLADRRWRDYEGGCHPCWSCARLAGELATDPAIESLCGAPMPHP